MKAEKILQEYKIEKLPIVDKNKKLIGLITYRDILQYKSHPHAYAFCRTFWFKDNFFPIDDRLGNNFHALSLTKTPGGFPLIFIMLA